MKITNKSFYALKFMLNLATLPTNGRLTVAELAHKENISEKFLESIVAMLKSNGIVKSKRGAGGGYLIGNSPSKITVRSVIEAVESDSKGFQPPYNEPALHSDSVLRAMFDEMDESVGRFFENITLASLVEKMEMQGDNEMFYI